LDIGGAETGQKINTKRRHAVDDKLTAAVSNLEETNALAIVKDRLDHGQDPASIFRACQEGMVEVGKRYENCEYYISDLLLAGAIFKEAAFMLTPRMKASESLSGGKVVIGTVKGDIHDIGKDIVVTMLKAANYEVYDLGVDVPSQRFIDVLKETKAPVVGLSALLTTAFDSMKETVSALNAAGLRSRVKVMIGGGPVTEETVSYTGADARGRDAQAAVTLCNRWIKEG
jgi:methanogenic corrinoid protein MtbC1